MPDRRPVLDSVEALLAEPTTGGRWRVRASPGRCLERVTIDGEPLVLKYLDPEADWTLRAAGMPGSATVELWRRGILDDLPDCFDQPIVGGRARRRAPDALRAPDARRRPPPGPGRRRPDRRWSSTSCSSTTWPHCTRPSGRPAGSTSCRRPTATSSCPRGWRPPRRRSAPTTWCRGSSRRAGRCWRRSPRRRPASSYPWPTTRRRSWRRSPTTPSTFVHGNWKLDNLGTDDQGARCCSTGSCPGAGAAAQRPRVVPRDQLPPPAHDQGGRDRDLPRGARAPRHRHRALVGPPARPVPARCDGAVRLGEGARRVRRRAGLVGGAGPDGAQPAGGTMTSMDGIGAAYDAAADGLAGRSGADVRPAGRRHGRPRPGRRGRAPRVLDAGAGTGVAGEVAAAPRRRARWSRSTSRTACSPRAAGLSAVGDLTRLPFADDAFDLVVAAFSLNHFDRTRPRRWASSAGSPVRCVATVFAPEWDHPAKEAVEGGGGAARLRAAGRGTPTIKAEALANPGPPELEAGAGRPGSRTAGRSVVEVDTGLESAGDLVDWRFGHGAHARRSSPRSRPTERAAPAPRRRGGGGRDAAAGRADGRAQRALTARQRASRRSASARRPSAWSPPARARSVGQLRGPLEPPRLAERGAGLARPTTTPRPARPARARPGPATPGPGRPARPARRGRGARPAARWRRTAARRLVRRPPAAAPRAAARPRDRRSAAVTWASSSCSFIASRHPKTRSPCSAARARSSSAAACVRVRRPGSGPRPGPRAPRPAAR